MTTCGQCGKEIKFGPNTQCRYSGDVRVCSKACGDARIANIYKVDSNMENPSRWNQWLKPGTLVEQRLALAAESYREQTRMGSCAYCLKPMRIADMNPCPWCRDEDAANYCTLSCQRKHWNEGHGDVCWRFGRQQPTSTRITPSFGNLIQNISNSFIGSCVGWIT